MNAPSQLADWSTAITEPTHELAQPRAKTASPLDALPLDERRPSDMPTARPYPWAQVVLLLVVFELVVRAFGR
jgi:hypothetical protein